jgi:hypothetical protein
MKVRGSICPLRHRKFITLLISLEEHTFCTSELMLEVRIHDIHTTVLHYINNCYYFRFFNNISNSDVFMGIYSHVVASSISNVRNFDLEEFRRTLNWI